MVFQNVNVKLVINSNEESKDRCDYEKANQSNIRDDRKIWINLDIYSNL